MKDHEPNRNSPLILPTLSIVKFYRESAKKAQGNTKTLVFCPALYSAVLSSHQSCMIWLRRKTYRSLFYHQEIEAARAAMAMARTEGFAFIPGLVPYTKIGDTDISKLDQGDGEKTPPPKSPDK